MGRPVSWMMQLCFSCATIFLLIYLAFYLTHRQNNFQNIFLDKHQSRCRWILLPAKCLLALLFRIWNTYDFLQNQLDGCCLVNNACAEAEMIFPMQ